MGRFTPNVLLSFAQFEREVTAERIRDKIAASKRKGLWMGGPTPLGFSVKAKKLVIDPAEAETVLSLFRLYGKFGAVDSLLKEANRRRIVSKRRTSRSGTVTGGKPFNRNNLYRLLRNPVYIGRIQHKDEVHPGQHEAIVDDDLWQSTQTQLDRNAKDRREAVNSKSHALLAGLLYDERGDSLRLTHTGRKAKRYKNYVSKRLLKNANQLDGWRLSANEIEAAVGGIFTRLLLDRRRLTNALTEAGHSQSQMPQVFEKAALLATVIDDSHPYQKRSVFQDLLQQVEIGSDAIVVAFNTHFQSERLRIEDGGTTPIRVAEPASMRRRGVESKLIIQSQEDFARRVDPKLCQTIAKARVWYEALARGDVDTIRELARSEDTAETEITRTLPLAFFGAGYRQVYFGWKAASRANRNSASAPVKPSVRLG